MNDDDNVLTFGQIKGGKADEDDGIPENNYIVTDIDGVEFPATGFLIFTPHHCAVMQDKGKGAIPVLVLPLLRVAAAEMVEDEEFEDEPQLI